MPLTYNGFTFGNYSHITVHTEMVEDEASRTILYHRHRITVQAIVVPTPSSSLPAIRRQLSEAGAALKFTDSGFGDLQINTAIEGGGVYDVEFGPKPRELSWKPIGSANAAEITWQVDVAAPVCMGNPSNSLGMVSFNFEMSFQISERGFTTRTITGHMIIAMTRRDRKIPQTADDYRDVINIGRPPNFQRISQDYRLTADKRRLDFTVIDKEVESRNAWPAGVVDIQASHMVRWTHLQLTRRPCVIQVRIALASDQPATRAWEIFLWIVAARIGQIDLPPSAENGYLITSLDVREELYGNDFAFQVTYRLTGGIKDLLADTGLLKTLATDWDQWDASQRELLGNRGIAGLRHTREMDRITDLCDDLHEGTGGMGGAPARVPPIAAVPRLVGNTPPPEGSWLEFEATLEESTESRGLTTVTLGESALQSIEFDPSATNNAPSPLIEGEEIERSIATAPPHMRWIWRGYAVRVGHEVPEPGILTVGNVELHPVGRRRLRRKLLGRSFGVPVHGLSWVIEYAVLSRPDSAAAAITNPTDPGEPAEPPEA